MPGAASSLAAVFASLALAWALAWTVASAARPREVERGPCHEAPAGRAVGFGAAGRVAGSSGLEGRRGDVAGNRVRGLVVAGVAFGVFGGFADADGACARGLGGSGLRRLSRRISLTSLNRVRAW